MSKRICEPITVSTCTPEPGGHPDEVAPTAFAWRREHYRVQHVLGHWREDAGWWVGGGVAVPQRDLWRVEARGGPPARGVYDLVAEAGGWRLERVWD